MYQSLHQTRVRYGETDRMGYCYYGNYAQFFEVGRVEALRNLGMTYRALEDRGILLPVLDYHVKFVKPAFYDDILTVKTMITEMPKVRFRFEYETLNEKDDVINVGETTLVFLNKETGRPMAAPDDLTEKLKPYLEP